MSNGRQSSRRARQGSHETFLGSAAMLSTLEGDAVPAAPLKQVVLPAADGSHGSWQRVAAQATHLENMLASAAFSLPNVWTPERYRE